MLDKDFTTSKNMKSRHRMIPLGAANEWHDALSGVNHAFAHTHDFCYAMYLTTGQKTYLYCFEQEGVRIVCPIIERSFLGYNDIAKPFGFSGFVSSGCCPDFHIYWDEFVRTSGYVSGYFSTHPVFNHINLFKNTDFHIGGSVQVLDLTRSMKEIVSDLDRNRWRQINKKESLDHYLIFDKNVLHSFLKNNYYKFLEERQAPQYYYFTNKTLSYLLKCENVVVAGVSLSGKCVALAMFGYTEYVADSLISISIPEGRKYSALLYWYGVKTLKNLGIPVVSFGGGDGGIYEFKRRFGCKDLPYYIIRQVYREDAYADLCRQTNTSHSSKDGYFPAYRGWHQLKWRV